MSTDLSKMSEAEKESFIEAIEAMLDYGNGNALTHDDMELYNRLTEERSQKTAAENALKGDNHTGNVKKWRTWSGTQVWGFEMPEELGVGMGIKVYQDYDGVDLFKVYIGKIDPETDKYITWGDNDKYLGMIVPGSAEDFAAAVNELNAGDNPITAGWEDGAGNGCSLDGWGDGIEKNDMDCPRKETLDDVIASAEKRRDEQNEIGAEEIDREAR